MVPSSSVNVQTPSLFPSLYAPSSFACATSVSASMAGSISCSTISASLLFSCCNLSFICCFFILFSHLSLRFCGISFFACTTGFAFCFIILGFSITGSAFFSTTLGFSITGSAFFSTTLGFSITGAVSCFTFFISFLTLGFEQLITSNNAKKSSDCFFIFFLFIKIFSRALYNINIIINTIPSLLVIVRKFITPELLNVSLSLVIIVTYTCLGCR